LVGSTGATAVPAGPGGVRAAITSTVGSTVAIEAPVTQGGAPIAIETPLA
ncbi:hypothetical protein N303_11770, partial [Cuculus canorus]